MKLRLRMFAGVVFFVLLTVAISFSPTASAQTTISTGSIQGTISDQSGAVLSGAKVTITNKDTGQAFSVTTTSAGAYASGALIPGQYAIRVEAKGFKATETQVGVQVNVTSSANIRLQVGEQ